MASAARVLSTAHYCTAIPSTVQPAFESTRQSTVQRPLLRVPLFANRSAAVTPSSPSRRRGLSFKSLTVRSLIQRHRDVASEADNQQAPSKSLSIITAATAAAFSASLFLAPTASAVSLEGFASVAQSSAVIAEISPDAASAVGAVLGPLFAALNFLFILRIVMSWYPQLPVSEFPFVIAYAPTEPILRITRAIIQPIGGVDIAPIVWLALISFLNEILLGQQGLLVLIANQESLL
ncbi:unnamed protein product [Closterium sp. Yama58-4]|nr:unnamed protein product [Closterium sp. Yama58-4]